MVVYGLFLNVFGINYNAYVMETYNTKTFKDIQYVESMTMAVAGILGYAIVAGIDILSSNIFTSFEGFHGHIDY